MTIRNNGPDVIPSSLTSASYPITRGFRSIGLFANSMTVPCIESTFIFDFPPGQPDIASTSFRSPVPLNAGDSITCIADLDVYPEAPALIQQDFFASLSPSVTDPDRSNNKKTLTFRTANDAHPVPFSSNAFWLLSLLMISVGALAARQNTNM